MCNLGSQERGKERRGGENRESHILQQRQKMKYIHHSSKKQRLSSVRTFQMFSVLLLIIFAGNAFGAFVDGEDEDEEEDDILEEVEEDPDGGLWFGGKKDEEAFENKVEEILGSLIVRSDQVRTRQCYQAHWRLSDQKGCMYNIRNNFFCTLFLIFTLLPTRSFASKSPKSRLVWSHWLTRK